MKDIEKVKYACRKEYDYDDDTAVLFYKGMKVIKQNAEDFRKAWVEESWNLADGSAYTLFDDLGLNTSLLQDEEGNLYEDALQNWETIWDELEWDENSKSYKYKNWELVILDL